MWPVPMRQVRRAACVSVHPSVLAVQLSVSSSVCCSVLLEALLTLLAKRQALFYQFVACRCTTAAAFMRPMQRRQLASLLAAPPCQATMHQRAAALPTQASPLAHQASASAQASTVAGSQSSSTSASMQRRSTIQLMPAHGAVTTQHLPAAMLHTCAHHATRCSSVKYTFDQES